MGRGINPNLCNAMIILRMSEDHVPSNTGITENFLVALTYNHFTQGSI